MEEIKDESAVAANTEKLARYRNFANKLSIIFWLKILMLVMAAFYAITAGIQSVRGGFSPISLTHPLAIAAYTTSLALGIAISVTTIILGKNHFDFIFAGVFYAIYMAVDMTSKLLSNNKIVAIISSVFSILYTLKFTEGMSNTFYSVDLGITGDWESLRKFFITIYITTIVSTVLILLAPSLAVIAGLVLIACAIGVIAASIWEILLIKRSAAVLKTFQIS